MSTSITPIAEGSVPTAQNAKFANPLKQVGGLLSQPAIRRSLPLIFMLGLLGAAALAWMSLATPTQKTLFANLSDADKAAVSQALEGAGIKPRFDDAGALTVDEDNYHKARMLLAQQDLPKAMPGGYAILDQLPMGVSRAVEGERLRQARETELARSIQEIDSVAEARVHLAQPESTVFVRDHAEASASVIVRLQAGRTLSDAQVRSIVNLVASSVPGMKPDNVTIVDQMGALLSKPSDGSGDSAGDKRIDFQRRIEDKYRQQLMQLLTPLLGAGNFSTEIQADVDLNESQATRESYDKTGVVRAEQGNWTAAPGTGGAQTPGGIPGALSNTAPPATQVQAAANAGQQAATTTSPTDPTAAAGAGAQPASGKASDQFSRAYDLGKEISVTKSMPGTIKRLSVAVLLREEPGKPRGRVEIKQIDDLVKAAVGFDQGRNDTVTVISRKFTSSTEAGTDADAPAWYEAGWVPLVARNVTALVIALLVLFLGVRPLSKALLKKRDDTLEAQQIGLAISGASPDGPAVSADMLGRGQSPEERIGLVRGFTRDNPARAALAVRDMIKSDAAA